MSEKASFTEYLLLLEKKKKRKKRKKKRRSKCSTGGTTYSGAVGWGWGGSSDGGGDAGAGGGMGESLIYELFGMRSAALPTATSANMLSIVRAQQQAEEEQEQATGGGEITQPTTVEVGKGTFGGLKGGTAPTGTVGGTGGKGESKYDRARGMIQSFINSDMDRKQIQEEFMKRLGLTKSTAESYYERLVRELGLKTDDNDKLIEPEVMGDNQAEAPEGDDEAMVEPPPGSFEIEGDTNRQGAIRTVPGSHLVYKRRNEEGTYDELWTFNTDRELQSEVEIKRAILAGTDIPRGSTKSQDGSQRVSLSTMGNAQMLHITGLPT